MSDDIKSLTLPGDIPGLLRRGSPVRFLLGGDECAGVVVGPVDGGAVVVWHIPGDVSGCAVHALITEVLHLDLSDATGRAHAALWLLEQDGADASRGACWRFWHGARGAVLKIEGGEHAALFASFSDSVSWEVPALADCKTAAEALRCAVLARAGREG